jgi:hypothetical protein
MTIQLAGNAASSMSSSLSLGSPLVAGSGGTGVTTYVPPDKVLMWRNAAFTAAAAWSKVPVDSVLFDTGSIADLTNSRITPKKSGYYTVTGRCSANFAGAGRLLPAIYKNGSLACRGNDISSTAAALIGGVVHAVIQCNGTTDYLELYPYFGTSANLEVGSYDVAFLSAVGPF